MSFGTISSKIDSNRKEYAVSHSSFLKGSYVTLRYISRKSRIKTLSTEECLMRVNSFSCNYIFGN